MDHTAVANNAAREEAHVLADKMRVCVRSFMSRTPMHLLPFVTPWRSYRSCMSAYTSTYDFHAAVS